MPRNYDIAELKRLDVAHHLPAQQDYKLIEDMGGSRIVTHADGTTTIHELSGNPIGFFPNDSAQFAEARITLQPGDRIHFFSDGVIEAMDAQQEIIGYDRLATAMGALVGLTIAQPFGAPEKKLGWNASPTAQVIFEECRVPVANRVGAEGDGFRFAMAGLDGGRLNIGACSLGGAQRCLDEAIAYTRDRQQFGQSVADFQNTQFMLADMATDLEAARALLYLAAAKVSANAPDKTRFSAMAKRLATDSGSEIVNKALQLFGGYGYLKDYPIERFWRDLRVHSILEGTNQIMRMIIGRELTRQ